MSNPKIRLKRGTNTQVTGYTSSAVAGEVLVDTTTPRLYFCATDGTLVAVANLSEIGGGSGSSIVLAGYSMASTAAAVAATDTVNQGIGKLEKRIYDLETTIDGGTLT